MGASELRWGRERASGAGKDGGRRPSAAVGVCLLLALAAGLMPHLAPAARADYPRYPAMGATYEPLESWVYPALERLAALGYAPTAMLGMRPWSRLECARLVEEAGELLASEPEAGEEARRLYRTLAREFADESRLLGGERYHAMQMDSLYVRTTGIGGPPLTDGYHFGQTIRNDYGRPYQEGFNAVSGFSGRAVSGRMAFYVRGEYQRAAAAPGFPDLVRQQIGVVDGTPAQPGGSVAAVSRFRLLDAYAALNVLGWQVSAGQQSLGWGPGQGGMNLSYNAAPVPMIRIARPVPLKLPGPLRWVGPMRTEFFIGKLSGHRFVGDEFSVTGDWDSFLSPQPIIHGQKLSFRPTPNLEFGFSRTVLFGGPGQPLTPRSMLRTLFSRSTEFGAADPGDRRSGFDATYRVPGLRRWLTVYVDAMTEDEPSPVAYPDRSAMTLGIYMPQLPGLRRADFRAEGGYTDLPGFLYFPGYFYINPRFKDGYTNDGNLLGGAGIGRQGHAFQLSSTYWISAQQTVRVGYRQARSSAEFLQGGSTSAWTGSTVFFVRPDVTLSGVVQYERWNFPLLRPQTESNVSVSFQFTLQPRWRLSW